MADITSNSIELSQTWGVAFNEYTTGTSTLDFQDLMVAVAEKRAVMVEGEVAPLTTHIRMRNAQLDTLAAFTDLQSKFSNDDSGDTQKTMGTGFQQAWIDLANRGSVLVGQGDHSNLAYCLGDFKNSDVEGLVSQYKSMIAGRNNAAQSDMSRLQSLVDRRDESYSTATWLSSIAKDTANWTDAKAFLVDTLSIPAGNLPDNLDSYANRIQACSVLRNKMDTLFQSQQEAMVELQSKVNRRDVAHSTSSNVVRALGTSLSSSTAAIFR